MSQTEVITHGQFTIVMSVYSDNNFAYFSSYKTEDYDYQKKNGTHGIFKRDERFVDLRGGDNTEKIKATVADIKRSLDVIAESWRVQGDENQQKERRRDEAMKAFLDSA